MLGFNWTNEKQNQSYGFLVYKGFEMCSQEKLCSEISKIKTILQQKWILSRLYYFWD